MSSTLVDSKLEELKQRVLACNELSPEWALEKLLTLEQGAAYRRHVPIVECGDGLVEIPATDFARVLPHPYQRLGAPYGEALSPFHIRTSVLSRLQSAQQLLEAARPGYRIQIFDAYRPKAVQRYMVGFELNKLARDRGLDPDAVEDTLREELLAIVHTIWARPTDDPFCPTPHSTGAALDVTILDENLKPLEMGGEIDEIGPVSLPSFYASMTDERSTRYHANRTLLKDVMTSAGFRRLPYEWWHFSYGDQLWALIDWIAGESPTPVALYGCVEP
ncbi:MAG: M15 family metallopeptidase [Bdellovibrionota bacterium]